MDNLRESSMRLVDKYHQWILGPQAGGTVIRPQGQSHQYPDRYYYLKSKVPRKFLQYESQTWGINLGWTDDAAPDTGRRVARWFFMRKGTSERPIRYGETIAIAYENRERFIRYQKRDVGINLNWSDRPVYEWQILGGKQDDAVETQKWVAIVNLEAAVGGEPFIYFDRTRGGDIGWPSSSTWGEQLKGAAWDEVKQMARELLREGLKNG